MSIPDIAIVVLARDRFATAPLTLQTILADKADGSRPQVYVADPGYPKAVIDRLNRLGDEHDADINIVTVGKYANTNHSWNQLLPLVKEEHILCIENDVLVEKGFLTSLSSLIESANYDVVAPSVYEADGVSPHFRPVAARINVLPGGSRTVELNRGRTDSDGPSGVRPIDIFERHCFLIRRRAALLLGDWDELMFCRTDLDLSIQAHTTGLKVAFTDTTSVTLCGPDLTPEDVSFFDFRWDVHRVGRSNERLISKWQLIGYKHTIDHAHNARRRLAQFTATEV